MWFIRGGVYKRRAHFSWGTAWEWAIHIMSVIDADSCQFNVSMLVCVFCLYVHGLQPTLKSIFAFFILFHSKSYLYWTLWYIPYDHARWCGEAPSKSLTFVFINYRNSNGVLLFWKVCRLTPCCSHSRTQMSKYQSKLQRCLFRGSVSGPWARNTAPSSPSYYALKIINNFFRLVHMLYIVGKLRFLCFH